MSKRKRKKAITARQKSARRKNMAIARTYRHKGHSRGETNATKSVAFSNKQGYSAVKGKGKKALYAMRAESAMKRVMQIQKNRPMSSLSAKSQKKVNALIKVMTESTVKMRYS